MSRESNRAQLLAWCDRQDSRLKKIREMATPNLTRDVSPECQAAYDIAVAATAAETAAYDAHQTAMTISNSAWLEYWDCESP